MTDGEGNDRVSAQEAFEYTCRGFFDALEILSQEPAQQVRLNGNYNTAFELIFHAGDGRYLLASDVGCLSDMQKAAISHFPDDVERLPFKHHSGRDDDPDVRFLQQA